VRFAVIGDPVAHSKSPAMHMAAYKALGMRHTYEAIPVTKADLPRLVEAVRTGFYRGLNVTVPHKAAVLALADEVSEEAREIGAANTLLHVPPGSVFACNTDAPALVAELQRLAPERTEDVWRRSTAIILGSGGAARAARAAVWKLGVTDVMIRARRGFDPLVPTLRDREVGTLIQATSAGMTGGDTGDAIVAAVDWDALPKSAIALDVVYSPPETPFLAAAKARGLRRANGFGMLVEQGAIAFGLWLGIGAPREAMRAALGAP